jgi:hypothetical protein
MDNMRFAWGEVLDVEGPAGTYRRFLPVSPERGTVAEAMADYVSNTDYHTMYRFVSSSTGGYWRSVAFAQLIRGSACRCPAGFRRARVDYTNGAYSGAVPDTAWNSVIDGVSAGAAQWIRDDLVRTMRQRCGSGAWDTNYRVVVETE